MSHMPLQEKGFIGRSESALKFAETWLSKAEIFVSSLNVNKITRSTRQECVLAQLHKFYTMDYFLQMVANLAVTVDKTRNNNSTVEASIPGFPPNYDKISDFDLLQTH